MSSWIATGIVVTPRYYGFNEWGTWGYCSACVREVTLDPDGYLADHKWTSSYSESKCPGGRQEPGNMPAYEVAPPPLRRPKESDNDE